MTTKENQNDAPENDGGDDELSGAIWKVPTEFGAVRGAVLEHSEAQLSDLALLVGHYYQSLLDAGIPPDFVYALTRDFNAQGSADFWNS